MFEFLITRPMGFIIKLIYDLVQNYGIAIILFTIVIKTILLPLNIRSQKAMRKQQKIQPYIAQLQEKYKNDQQKLQTEMMKVYKENNVSMMGGCLPMLIQFPILIGLYQVIQKPLQYMLGVVWDGSYNEIVHLRDAAAAIGAKMGSYANTAADQILSIWNQGQIYISQWAAQVGTTGSTLEGVQGTAQHPWVINFNLFGLNLSTAPSEAFNEAMSNGSWMAMIIFIIPVLAVALSFISMKITQVQSGQNQSSANAQANQMSKTMNLMMPLMTGFFTIILPAGLGLYWIISSLMQIVQQLGVNFYLEKKGEDAVVIIPEKKQLHGKKRKK